MSNSDLCDELLAFWFGGADDDAAVAREQARLWWSKDPETDRLIEERYVGALSLAANRDFLSWPENPRGRLARVILLDQLPRNIYRGRPEAFAWDALARREANAALAVGDEAVLRPIERVFLYMPFEHAEDMALQDLAVEKFAALCRQIPESSRSIFQGFLDYAIRHRDIIRRFGRFPHRNAILERPSTVEEIAFLREPGSSF